VYKYQNLLDYLKAKKPEQDRIILTFAEIESILGFDLPPSARFHRPWWGNESKGTHTHRLSWMNAGWLVDGVDLVNSSVSFRRK